MRLRSDFWVAAHLRRCDIEMIAAVLRRRGASEAGAVYVKLDRLDAYAAVLGPAPQSDDALAERRFIRVHRDRWIPSTDAEARLRRLIDIDPDIWILEMEGDKAEALLTVVE